MHARSGPGILLLSLSALGAAATLDPLQVIRASNERVARLLRPGRKLAPADREEVLRVIDRTSHFPTIARRILARRWDEASAEQREAFVTAFSRLVGFTSIQKMGRYQADRVLYLGQQVDGGAATVMTAAFYKGKRVSLDYELALVDGEWRVVDYALNGVKSSANYRRQFDRILPKEGLDGLIARLRKKLASLEKPAVR